MSVAVVGVYTIDLFMYGPRLPGPGETVDCPEYAESHGGKAANQAVAAARLGADTALITRLGKDRSGQAALKLFQEEGLDTRFVSLDEQAGTGVGFIIVDQDGMQIITTYAGASARLSDDDLRLARPVLEQASVLLLQGEIPAQVSFAAARLAGEATTVILNPSPVETFDHLPNWDNVDILTPNEQEAAALLAAGKPSAEALSKVTGVPTVVLTLGAEGAEVFHQGEQTHVPAPQVRVVDTTGAGDAFSGAFAAGLDRGLDLLHAAQHACRCAAFSVGRRHCIPSFPTLEDMPWDETG